MGLSGSEPFTPELQDKMGRMLLNRRGLQAYRAGRISKGTFALALSQEFASLPDPTTGRSFYHGDGLNASRVPRSAVYRALGLPLSQPPIAPTRQHVVWPAWFAPTLPFRKALGVTSTLSIKGRRP